jgi:hypothetical protein
MELQAFLDIIDIFSRSTCHFPIFKSLYGLVRKRRLMPFVWRGAGGEGGYASSYRAAILFVLLFHTKFRPFSDPHKTSFPNEPYTNEPLILNLFRTSPFHRSLWGGRASLSSFVLIAERFEYENSSFLLVWTAY